MKTLVKGGRILDPKNQIDEVADLFIADKTICGIGCTPSGFTADRSLDAGDKIVCPGFIEIGCDLEGLSPDTFNVEQELRAATAGGFITERVDGTGDDATGDGGIGATFMVVSA